ncbi:MAG: chemotaxis protein CheB, partial [Phycisphaerae bacterium]|nr:chemotaxis protein CheB [Phycisphaerae bacterium]
MADKKKKKKTRRKSSKKSSRSAASKPDSLSEPDDAPGGFGSEDDPPPPSLDFPVVGIGASAGGLDAFKKFFDAMPAGSGMAMVVVPHLDPEHESLMVQLLARHTEMPVHTAAEGMAIEPNAVYVIPPNNNLAVENGRLRLSPPTEPRGFETAIDFFLRSLARDQRGKAICVILSGTSSHGVMGLREIKLTGGTVMVQTPQTAAFDQMPRNAIATGLVDYVLPVEQMPQVLMDYARQPYVTDPSGSIAPSDRLLPLLAMLRAHT